MRKETGRLGEGDGQTRGKETGRLGGRRTRLDGSRMDD